MRRILMGVNAWRVFTDAVPATAASGVPLIGVPIEREPYLAPDDVWIERDDGSWERVAGAPAKSR